MYTLEKANQYIEQNKSKVVPEFRLKYHAMPDIGWMNDPNGLVYYKNRYHVFFQHYPYDSVWGAMHWGHLVSDDLVIFRSLPVALAPDQEDETGCFSGGAIVDPEDPDLLYLFYTKHYEKHGIIRETQGLAISRDGIRFEKRNHPVIGVKDLPEHASITDFRDPNPFYHNGYYYVFIGSKNHSNDGQFLIYRSKDLNHFEYHDTIRHPKYFGTMAECPDFSMIDGQGVFLYSAINLQKQRLRFRNINSSLYIIGDFDLERKTYAFHTIDEIDKGHHFYAPQTLVDGRGRTIMIAWMDMWGQPYVTHELGHYWSGALTFPRELMVKGGILYQYPVEEIKNYYGMKIAIQDGVILPKQVDLFLMKTAEPFSIVFSNILDENDAFTIQYDGSYVWFDGEKIKLYPLSQRSTTYCYEEVSLRILLDTSSVEIFVNEGREAITSRVYLRCDGYRLQVRGNVQGEAMVLNV